MAARGMAALRAVEVAPVGRCGQPLDAEGREIVPVRMLLEWAFGRECAQLDVDEIGLPGSAGVDSARRVAEAMALSTGAAGSCLRVDVSGGRSLPHADAEIVAAVLRASVPWHVAVTVAGLARAGVVPRWDLGPQRFVPRAWGRENQHGRMARSEVLRVETYRSARRGLVKRPVLWTPVTVEPSASQVAAARRGYLDWWGALLAVQAGLRGVSLELFSVSGAMPPLEPWKKRA